ncbi:MAG: ABC transporter ATP-binding protein [Pseudopedobacter saltans]|uniref:ABC transporter ATP-binding protein n=1 Tax=Pseudopedobacter saltans TaxID=151895 RepID=A0A2W5EY69_9SPHI|nr:MAG: ABC transporter ATP-binding protein [Pseudopedobacter saltans]
MINIQNLQFAYRKNKPVFEGLHLRLEPGHIYGLLGENGTGKSTLLKLMSGLAFPQAGQVQTLGYNPEKRNPNMLQQIAFIPEEFDLLPMSIAKFVKVNAPFYPSFDNNKMLSLLKEFQIPEGQAITDMSYGQKKKLLISFGLATNAKLIIMDEPTNGLDIPSKAQFRKIIAGFLNEESIIIISTHQVRDLDNLIDTILMLDDHRIVLNATVDAITDKLTFSNTSQPVENALYSESSFNSYQSISFNKGDDYSKLDMELLFKAVLIEKLKITQLFN